MNEINDGGPAFPLTSEHLGHATGMSFRAYAAVHALQGFCSNNATYGISTPEIIRLSLVLADELIKQLENRS